MGSTGATRPHTQVTMGPWAVTVQGMGGGGQAAGAARRKAWHSACVCVSFCLGFYFPSSPSPSPCVSLRLSVSPCISLSLPASPCVSLCLLVSPCISLPVSPYVSTSHSGALSLSTFSLRRSLCPSHCICACPCLPVSLDCQCLSHLSLSVPCPRPAPKKGLL